MATAKTVKTVKEPPEPALTYEQARDELIEVVNLLESGNESLADSMELYKRGEYLAGLCESYLTDAKAMIEQAAPSDC